MIYQVCRTILLVSFSHFDEQYSQPTVGVIISLDIPGKLPLYFVLMYTLHSNVLIFIFCNILRLIISDESKRTMCPKNVNNNLFPPTGLLVYQSVQVLIASVESYPINLSITKCKDSYSWVLIISCSQNNFCQLLYIFHL